MTEKTFIDFDPNDFIIRLSPEVVDGKWTGDLDVGMITTDDNILSSEDFSHLRMLTDMLICAIPLMERNPEFRSQLFSLLEESLEEKPKVIKREGNVLNVNF
jgi:hypothetical protein